MMSDDLGVLQKRIIVFFGAFTFFPNLKKCWVGRARATTN